MKSYDYVGVGETVKATPYGVSKPSDDEGTVGYVWVLTDAASERDTVRFEDESESISGAIEYVIPDTTGCITFTCMAYASGYTSKSISFTVSIVDPVKSMKDLNYSDKCKEFTDARNGKTYKYETVGTLDWFCRNLEFSSDEVKGIPFCKCDIMEAFFGDFYTWDQAKAACPEGWRLPTDKDWVALANNVTGKQFSEYNDFEGASVHLTSDAYFNDARMWEFWPETRPTFKTSLNLLPTGYATISPSTNSYYFYDSVDTDFNYFCAMYWTADEYDADKAFYRYIYNDKYPNVLSAYASKNSVAMPVRCVRDTEN